MAEFLHDVIKHMEDRFSGDLCQIQLAEIARSFTQLVTVDYFLLVSNVGLYVPSHAGGFSAEGRRSSGNLFLPIQILTNVEKEKKNI